MEMISLESKGLSRSRRNDLLAVQGTLKSLLKQFKSINSSVLSLLYGLTLTSIHGLLEKL